MFMGSRHAPYPAFDAIMESWGGHNNGTTSNDRTNYYEIGPRNLLETFLWLEADRLATLPDVITAEELEKQLKVVQNERRQSYENRPYGRAELAIPEAMYPADHPYHWPTIGSHEDLEAATVDDVRAFFDRFYRPVERQPGGGGRLRSGPGARAHRPLLRLAAEARAARARAAPRDAPPGGRRRDLADRPRAAAAAAARLAHAGAVRAGRRRSRSGGARPGRRQVEPALPRAGVRAAHRAGRLRLPGVADAGQRLPHRRHRQAGSRPRPRSARRSTPSSPASPPKDRPRPSWRARATPTWPTSTRGSITCRRGPISSTTTRTCSAIPTAWGATSPATPTRPARRCATRSRARWRGSGSRCRRSPTR